MDLRRRAAFGGETAVALGVWLVLGAWLAVAGRAHEPWLDEAQAWLLARDSDPVDLLVRRVRYEGSPALWHLLLWTVQRLGLPYAGLYLVSSACAWAGAGLVLFRAPFPLWMRVGTAASYFFAYQYAVVARSYALDLVLIPLLAAAFDARLRRPLLYGSLLALLANANAHSFVLAAVLALEWGWRVLRDGGLRPDRRLGGGAIYGLGALAAVAQAWPSHDPGFQSFGGVAVQPARPLWLTIEAVVDRPDILGIAITLAVLAPVALLSRAGRTAGLTAGLFGGLWLFTFVISSNLWHAGLFWLTLLFVLWVNWRAVPALSAGWRAWLTAAVAGVLALQVADTAVAWAHDLQSPYSASRAAAAALERIRRLRPQDRVAALGVKTFSVQPMSSSNVFANFTPQDARAFYRWRPAQGVPLYATPQTWADLTRRRAYDWLLISTDDGLRRDRFDLLGYERTAALSGYCLARVFPGQMFWRMRVAEPDAMALFGRCGRPAP